MNKEELKYQLETLYGRLSDLRTTVENLAIDLNIAQEELIGCMIDLSDIREELIGE